MGSQSIPDHDNGDFKHNINHLLKRLFHEHLLTINEKFHELELFEGMGWGQQRVIIHLLHHKGDIQSNIAKKSNIARATVNKTISIMEEKGLIYKVKDESQKRAYKLFLTDKGQKMRGPIEKKINEIQEIILDGFSTKDQEELKKFLIKMIHNLNDHRKDSEINTDDLKTKIKVIIKKDEN